MPIQFYCDHCYSQVITPDDTAGKKGRCPNCSAVVSIPGIVPGSPIQPKQPGPQNSSVGAPVRKTVAANPVPADHDPFKPTKEQPSGYSESVEKQFGIEDLKQNENSSHWGEDTEISLKMRKAIAKEQTQNRLVGPAQTLITLAVVNLIVVALAVAVLFVYLINQSANSLDIDEFWVTFAIIMISVVMLDSAMIFIGGNHMRNARSYSMAYTGAVFALLPLNLLFFVTIPFGAWAIMTLNDPRIAEGFKAR